MKSNMHLRWPLLMFLTIAVASGAWAANVHLKPPNKNPSFIDNGLTLTAFGALAGLGEADIAITLSAQADVTAVCTNPSGANQPPGRNPAPITATGSQAIPASDITNGNTTFNVTTTAPTTPIPGAPGCPNPQWTESITDLSFKDAKLTVEQPLGTTVLTVFCRFIPATSNGPVPVGNVICP
jgi:hypothetical protein